MDYQHPGWRQDAVPHPTATRDADNTPRAPLLAWDIVDTNHDRMACIRAVFGRIARFSRLDTPVLPAGEHCIFRDSQRV